MADQSNPTTVKGRYENWLTPSDAGPIFEDATRRSVVQQLVPSISIDQNGVKIPFTTKKAQAAWVGEGDRKPTTESGLDLLHMEPHKIAAISVESAEMARLDPANYTALVRQHIAEAIAEAFDMAALYGENSPFDTAISDTDKSQALGEADVSDGGVYQDLNSALRALVADRKKLTGWAFDTVAEPLLNSAVDGNGRPLFVESPYDDPNVTVRPGRLMGRPTFLGEGLRNDDTIGFAGDWSKARWGSIGGISWDVSTDATVTIDGSLVSLFENNLIAIRAEAEFGFVVGDTNAFVKLTDADANGS